MELLTCYFQQQYIMSSRFESLNDGFIRKQSRREIRNNKRSNEANACNDAINTRNVVTTRVTVKKEFSRELSTNNRFNDLKSERRVRIEQRTNNPVTKKKVKIKLDVDTWVRPDKPIIKKINVKCAALL